MLTWKNIKHVNIDAFGYPARPEKELSALSFLGGMSADENVH
jgi:hypothetical protein